MPPNKSIAIVKYTNNEHARNAFNELFEYKIKKTPIFIEWAPKGLFIEEENVELEKH